MSIEDVFIGDLLDEFKQQASSVDAGLIEEVSSKIALKRIDHLDVLNSMKVVAGIEIALDVCGVATNDGRDDHD